MAIAVGTQIQINGNVSATSDTSMDVTCYEVVIGNEIYKFTPDKVVTIATTEYNTAITYSELQLIKKWAVANKDNQALTVDEKTAANSLISKIS